MFSYSDDTRFGLYCKEYLAEHSPAIYAQYLPVLDSLQQTLDLREEDDYARDLRQLEADYANWSAVPTFSIPSGNLTYSAEQPASYDVVVDDARALWVSHGSPEWQEAYARWHAVKAEMDAAHTALKQEAEQSYVDALPEDVLVADALLVGQAYLRQLVENAVQDVEEVSCTSLVMYVEFALRSYLRRLRKNDEDYQRFHEGLRSLVEKEREDRLLLFSQTTPLLKSVLPKNYYITNNKLSNHLHKDFMDAGEIMLSVINPNRRGEVCTYNSLVYEGEDIAITGRQTFTAYDRMIHNAVCTLYEAGNRVVTPAMVYRAANGMRETERISPQSIGAVTKSIDKSRFTRLKIDYTQEATVRGWEVDRAEMDSNLLYARALLVSAGGQEVKAYEILEKPALYVYSQMTKQVISVPINLLNTSAVTRNTPEIMPIKEYLLRRIEIMRHSAAMHNKIAYSTLFDEVGLMIDNKTIRKRYRDYIHAILDLWMNKYQYIKSFSEYKEGKVIAGLQLYV